MPAILPPLFYAIQKNDKEKIELLLEQGAEIADDELLLSIAPVELMSKIIEKRDINELLMKSLECVRYDIAEFLISKGAKILNSLKSDNSFLITDRLTSDDENDLKNTLSDNEADLENNISDDEKNIENFEEGEFDSDSSSDSDTEIVNIYDETLKNCFKDLAINQNYKFIELLLSKFDLNQLAFEKLLESEQIEFLKTLVEKKIIILDDEMSGKLNDQL